MADTRKIVSETFVDEKGNIVKDAKDAARIEVVERLPSGETRSTVLIKKAS